MCKEHLRFKFGEWIDHQQSIKIQALTRRLENLQISADLKISESVDEVKPPNTVGFKQTRKSSDREMCPIR